MPGLKVIYQDDCLLVIDKQPGIVVTPSETQQEETVSDILSGEFKIPLERGGVVHRLDKDTSGVLLAAKTQICLENLQFQFQQRSVKKEYTALVHGEITKPGNVEGAIGRNPGNREKFIVLDEGKEAATEYVPVKNFQFSIFNFQTIFEGFNKNQWRRIEKSGYGKFSLIHLFPQTGRTHQIRVHLKYIGHPVVGDEKYGGRKTSRLDKRWCPRQFLHALRIEFTHPQTGQRMSFESPLPDDLKQALQMLEGEK